MPQPPVEPTPEPDRSRGLLVPLPEPQAALTPLEAAGQIANVIAAAHVFDDYLARKARNTLRTQRAALGLLARFLQEAGVAQVSADTLQQRPAAWRGVTWGLVQGFVNWLLHEGFSIASVNNRLSVVKTYARLAAQAGALARDELQLIRTVTGYGTTEGKRVDERRDQTRQTTTTYRRRGRRIKRHGTKKAAATALTTAQAQALKQGGPPTPQGRRDRLIFCLLLDHGLRAGEVAGLTVADFNLAGGEMRFYRPKVDRTQTHRLSRDTQAAAAAYFAQDAPAAGKLLLAARKGGALTERPLSLRGLGQRVRAVGRATLGLRTLSPHDCRHYWATTAARYGTPIDRLQDAGGWASPSMPLHYIEAAAVANEGVVLDNPAR